MKPTGHKVQAGVAVLAFTALVFTLGAGGCGGDDEKPTATVKATACTAGAKECLDPTLARVCPSDGSGWLVQRCAADEKCEGGDCKADVAVTACDRNTGTCVNPTTALRCRDDLKGYESISCPPGTTCQGAGLCAGACVVGSKSCINSRTLGACNDGRGITPTLCAGDELCVNTSSPTATIANAACKAGECNPTTCSPLCGNKIDPAADQTKFVSTCAATPEGYKWQLTACTGYQSCSGGCGSQCSSACIPGTMRCSSNRLGLQTCGADGKWAVDVTACNATANEAALFCMIKPDDSSKVVCGNLICASGSYKGTCEGGNFRACDANGKLGAPAPCAQGACIATGAPSVGGYAPALCQAECKPGDERCSGPGFQACTSNGRWGNVTLCPPGADGGVTCRSYSNPQGRPAKVCNGVCTPGTRRCTGAALSLGTAAIEECGTNGQWAAAVNCAVGACRTNFAGSVGAACVAECIPGAVVCAGGSVGVPGVSVVARDSWGTCSAQGLLPTAPTLCGVGTACRKGPNGSTIMVGATACVECVGGQIPGGNEYGQTDRRCTNASGDGGGSTTILSCSDANTWTGALTSCEALSRFCIESGSAGAVCL